MEEEFGSNMFSVTNVIARMLLIFFLLYQISRNFKFLVLQAIVFDLEAIWDLATIYYQAYIFHKVNSRDRLNFVSKEQISIW